MPVLLSGKPGRVFAIAENLAAGALPDAMFGSQPGLSFASHRVLVSRVTMSEQTSQQFAHTLGGVVYIYVFGDRMGEMTISGLGVAGCNGEPHGLLKAREWYRENRVAMRARPVQVMIHREAISGYVIGFNADVVNAEMNLAQFTLQLALLPER